MPLTILNEANLTTYACTAEWEDPDEVRALADRLNAGVGVYIGGWNIAPDAYLIRAAHFADAWEVLVETMADAGQLAECEVPQKPDGECAEECDGCEWTDSGRFVTLDVVLRTIRPARGD